MVGHPKPPPREPKKLKRAKRLPKATKKIKFSNAYTRPYPVAQARRVRRRCGGICEAQVRCGGNPMVGMPHHLRYDERFKGPKRLEVPDEDVIGCCRPCHLWFEAQK